jgi:hypothetical protein
MAMSDSKEQTEKLISSQETSEYLQRILKAVEKDKRKQWVEIVIAVLLSLATMASAWCAYQSTLWGGAQTFRLAAASKAGREGSEARIAALQFRAFDASMFIDYLEAKSEGNESLQKLLYERFRPEMRTVMDAWLKTDPFNNPAAPSGPFKMAEYVQKELEEAKKYDDLASQKRIAAEEANQISDTYVLLTVMFASVLFFGGVSGTFDSRRLRLIVCALAIVLFVVTVIALGTMPICQE